MPNGIVLLDLDYEEAFDACCKIYGEDEAINMFLDAGLAEEEGISLDQIVA